MDVPFAVKEIIAIRRLLREFRYLFAHRSVFLQPAINLP